MKGAEPIKDIKVVNKLLRHMLVQNVRDYLIAWIGFNYGLRIGDIVKLKGSNLVGDQLVFIEEKTGNTIKLPAKRLRDKVLRYVGKPKLADYWFKSRQVNAEGKLTHVTPTQAYRQIRKHGKEIGIKISTHTMRKTFAYHHFKQNNDLLMLSKSLGHTSIDNTLVYLPKELLEVDVQEVYLYN